MQPLIQTASSVRLSINGKVVGFCTSLAFSRSTATKYIYEIDNPIPKEIMPTTYSIQGSMTGIRLRGAGGLDAPQIMDISSVAKYFTQKYITIEVIDRVSSKVIYTIQKCMFDTDSWNISVKNVITFSGNFKGTFVSSDEAS